MLAAAALLIYSFFIIYPGDLTESSASPAVSNIQLYVNGEKIEPDAPPQIVNGTTFIPIRWVADALDATIGWDASSKSLRVNKGKTTLRLTVDSTKAMQGDETVTLSAKPFISHNRTYVPVRWISEALALDVAWDAETKSVMINEQQSSASEVE